MRKIFGILLLLLLIAIPVKAYMGSSFDEPIKVCASHILVPEQVEAEKLKLEIKTYQDFQQLAAIYSQCPSGKKGGYLGCFGRGQMVKPFEKAAFNANVGEVVGPVKTEFFDIAEEKNSIALYKRLVMANPVKVVRKAMRDMRKGKMVSVYGITMNLFRLLCKLCPQEIIMNLGFKKEE